MFLPNLLKARLNPLTSYVLNSSCTKLCLFCTWLFLSLNDRCPEFGRSRTFFSSTLSPFSDYRFDISHLDLCRLSVLGRWNAV